MVRDNQRARGKFTSIVDLKVKLMEEFEDKSLLLHTFLLVTLKDVRQSTKKWLVTQDDLTATYSLMRQSGKTNASLCDGCSEESDSQRKRKRDDSPGPTSKRAEKEKDIDDLVTELKEMHSAQHNYSNPQYQLWARMITDGIHFSKETPPHVLMITGAMATT